MTVLITESHASNAGDFVSLDELEPLVERDLVSHCEECTQTDPIWHLEPGTSWFLVNRVVRDGR